MNKIFAIVGMCGVGKSVACDYLEKNGFQKVYFGGVTMDKLKEEGLEVNETNEKMMRESLRKEYGMGAYAVVLLPKIEDFAKKGDVVLDGLYSWTEYKILKERFSNLNVIALVEDKHLRYGHLNKRKRRPLNEEEAIKRDISEIENLEKGGPIAFADFYVDANCTKEELINKVQKIVDIIDGDKSE